MRKRVAIAVLLVVMFGAGLPAAWAVIRAQGGYRAAEELLAHELWPQARERLASYLWLYPGDAQARMRMAEAFAKDEALPPDEAASQAIRCLAQISDNSPLAAEARLQQGRLCFLILQKPGRAEQLLRKSVELGGSLPAYQLLWTLLNVTGRAEESEDVFWRVYELSSEDERPLRLREWYMNQFFPTTANEPLDRMMGILAPGETPTGITESHRYLRFREREPESPLSHAAAAQWCQHEGDPQFAIRLLDAAAKELPAAASDPFFLSVSIATHLDLGQFDQAQACFQRWPENDRGHAYWKWRAIIMDDVLGHYEEALEAYDQALKLWPGPIDWRLHHRQAGCLARLRKSEDAAAAQDRATQLGTLMKAEAHDRLRADLGSLDDPQPLTEVAQFYHRLGRDREANCWEDYIRRLQAHVQKPP
jgi:tetratricopeptide (TPR) repeat protein